MRKLFVFLIIFLIVDGHAQTTGGTKDKVLDWADRKLVWTDFRGMPPSELDRGTDIARTMSTVFSKYYVNSDTIKYAVLCQFFVDKSWTITDRLYSLNHEQKHFDLAEVHARRLRKYYSQLNCWTEKTASEITRNVIGLNDAGHALQDVYDRETRYGRDSVKQKQWNIKVQKMLDSLIAYKMVNGIVVLRNK